MSRPTRLLLVRHGATPFNEALPVILQGCGVDSALSESGLRQAAAVASALATAKIDAIYSSPLRRARQTAEAIASPHALSVAELPRLHEIDVGQWEQRTWPQIQAEFPDDYQRVMDDPAVHPYLGGECYGDVLCRAKPQLLETLARHPGETIVVVAHRMVNCVLIADALGLPLGRARHLRQDNCCVNVLSASGDRLDVVTLNANLHLWEREIVLASERGQ
jgi:broad specificity phosphatase PhoE